MVITIPDPLGVAFLWVVALSANTIMHSDTFPNFVFHYFFADNGFPVIRLPHNAHKWLILSRYPFPYINSFGFGAYIFYNFHFYLWNILYSIIAIYVICKAIFSAQPVVVPQWVFNCGALACFGPFVLENILNALNRLLIAIHRSRQKRIWRK